MNDHFDHEHLRAIEDKARNGQITREHPKCREEGVKLEHLDHFRNHIHRVHGV